MDNSNFSQEIINSSIAEVCSKAGETKKGNIEIRLAVPFVSEATYDSTEKDKQKLVDITCRHSLSGTDNKKNNKQIHERYFDHSTLEDMLQTYECSYRQLQKNIGSCGRYLYSQCGTIDGGWTKSYLITQMYHLLGCNVNFYE